MERKRSGYRTIEGKQVWHTTVTLVCQEQHDGGPFCFGASYEDGTLNKVIQSLTAIVESIPVDYRDQARCEISSCGGYEGSHCATIEVNYERPETMEETVERQRKEQETKTSAEAKDRAAYEDLRRRFG